MDSLPKVTLLGAEGNTFVLAHGAKLFEFQAGKGMRVPVPIALICRKKRDRKGNSLFSISDMPTIVTPKGVEEKKVPAKAPRKKQNVTARTSQTELEI